MGVGTFDDDNFRSEVLESDVPVLVDFYSTHCGPCKAMEPTVEQLAVAYAGRVKVGKLNLDDAPTTAMNHGVRAVPTFLFFRNGEAVDVLMGARKKRELEARLDALLE